MSTFELRLQVVHAWQRVNGLANLYEDKANTLRPDGAYPGQAELEPLRAQMLQAVAEAEALESRLRAAQVEEQSLHANP